MFRQLALYSEFTARRVLIIVNKIGSRLLARLRWARHLRRLPNDLLAAVRSPARCEADDS